MTDKKLEALFNAVDDYLYSEVPGGGYPEGHCNPRYLEALRQAFLAAVGPEEDNVKVGTRLGDLT